MDDFALTSAERAARRVEPPRGPRPGDEAVKQSAADAGGSWIPAFGMQPPGLARVIGRASGPEPDGLDIAI